MKYLSQINSPADLRRFSVEDLPEIATELRQLILETISERGGHLGAALGAVELAMALHYVFDSPVDKIIWDIGHQAHAHKIITGRRDQFSSIRSEGGISGFTKRSESEHDIFGAGHSSTSISAALGIREALLLKNDPGKVIAVIGDASLTGGMAFEALNNAGALRRDLIVVLNDNEMSISPSVGALSEWLSRKLTGNAMMRWRRRIRSFLDSFDNVGENAIRLFERAMESTKVLLTPGILFEGLGFEYVGPIDGHDPCALIETFRNAQRMEQPVLVHVVTVKGKGYRPAEENAERFHGLGPFDLATGQPLSSTSTPKVPTYTQVFGETLTELAQNDPRIVAITAAMLDGTGLNIFAERFPGRVYDVGIAEQHAVTFAAGLACEGFRPVVAIYSAFLQRAFDQIVHDVCLQELPVIFCMDRAGLVGEDGPTHHGVLDPAFLRIVPNMALLAPRDENELRHMLATAVAANGPVAIRYPRGAGLGIAADGAPHPLPWGKAEVMLAEGHDCLIIAAGPHAHTALAAARELKTTGVDCTVINARFLKPLDEELLSQEIAQARVVLTIEESSLAGGFGSAILELCEKKQLRPLIHRLGIPDENIPQGTIASQQNRCGLGTAQLISAYRSLASTQRLISIA